MNTTLEIRRVVTRKAHRCWGCGEKFPLHTPLQVVSGVEDGHFFHSYWCPICEVVWTQLDSFERGEEFGMGELKDNYPEVWAKAAKETI